MTSLQLLELREMRESDLDIVRGWRNAEHVRRYMYSDHIISAEEHRLWFERCSKDPAFDLIISEYKSVPYGFINIYNIDPRHGTCSWAFYIGPEDAPKGLGSLMEFATMERIVNKHKTRKIEIEILGFNERVIKMHKRFGYVEEGIFRQQKEKAGDYHDVHRMAMFTKDWPAIREKLAPLMSR